MYFRVKSCIASAANGSTKEFLGIDARLDEFSDSINPFIEEILVNYGVKLTYKETYLGNGVDAWNTFLKIPTEEYALKEDLNTSILPPKNLFFIDIATWDRIVLLVKSGGITLKDLLLKAVRYNEKSETIKFSFMMHLEDYQTRHFSYLDKIDKIIDFDKFVE